MDRPLIYVDNLNFSYDGKLTIKNLNLSVTKGTIFGFLGPNGAGKTTVIKILLGLLQIKSNTVFLFEKDITKHRIEILNQIGSVVETPSLYPHLSGRENLNLTAKLFDISNSHINSVLEAVDMQEDANRPVKQYSTGMKQRLAFAQALLRNPDLLILDEPINGLDPTGIIKIRNLLLSINEAFSTTIFISSHQLSEIQKLATKLAIIHQGELLFQGTMEQLEQKLEKKQKVCFETNDGPRAYQLLKEKLDCEVYQNQIIFPFREIVEISNINKELIRQGIEVYQINTKNHQLEDLFVNLINQ